MYREDNAFHRSGTQSYSREDILLAFSRFQFSDVAASNHLMIGEIGASLTASDLSNELTAFKNCLDIFNERRYSYLSWWFSEDLRFAEHLGESNNFSPTTTGQILINALTSSPPPEEPPIPPPPAQYYDVNLLSATGGYTVPSAGSYHQLVEHLFSASAYSFEDYEFTRWLLNGYEHVTTPSVTIEGAEGLTYILHPVFTASPGDPEEPPPEPPPPVEPPPEEEPPVDPTPPPETPQLPDSALPIGDATLFSQLIKGLETTRTPSLSDVIRMLSHTTPISFEDVLRILKQTRVNA
jgi:hypothetical protein